MNKNLIYIVNIDSATSKFQNSDYAQYSILTWEHYCKRHNIDLIVCTKSDPRFKFPIWNKELIYNVGKDYDKLGIVDSDTMVRWDAPNIFDQVEPDKFYGVNDLCDINWLMESIEQRQRFFPNIEIDLMKYLNAGVLFFGKRYLYVFKTLLNFYLENQDEIHKINGGGKEQTLLNFVLKSENVDVSLLEPSWNLLSIHRKNMFQNNWQLKIDPTPYFIKYAYVWHFTGFPIEDRTRLMQQTWEATKQNYECQRIFN